MPAERACAMQEPIAPTHSHGPKREEAVHACTCPCASRMSGAYLVTREDTQNRHILTVIQFPRFYPIP